MNKREIIERLKNIAGYAVHTVGEEPFVMSLDDGIAVHEAIELLKKPETNCSEFPNNSDTISRQAESNPLEKCYTCKHVYQRVSDADTLYCRCRKGCKYEEFKPKRSNNDSGRHED